MEARRLTNLQKQHTLNAEKVVKKVLRHALYDPNPKTWPLIDGKDEHVLLDTINNVIIPLNISKLNKVQYPKELKTRKEKNEFKKRIQHEHWEQGKEKRSWLVFGINEVTKNLESDKLCAVLVSRDIAPAMMTQHLISLCVTRNVIAASIRKLKETLNCALNLKSCIALGLKRGVDDPNNLFHEIYAKLKSVNKPLPDVQTQLALKPSISKEITEKAEIIDPPKAEGTPLDFRQFYVYKSQGKFVPTSSPLISVRKTDADFLALSKSDEDSDNEMRKIKYKPADIREIKSSDKPKKKRRKLL